jgi:hypothetical protein
MMLQLVGDRASGDRPKVSVVTVFAVMVKVSLDNVCESSVRSAVREFRVPPALTEHFQAAFIGCGYWDSGPWEKRKLRAPAATLTWSDSPPRPTTL